jgi:hypothetical protein
MHDIMVVKRTVIKKITAPYSQLSKTSEGPRNVIQRSLPSCGLTLPNHVSPKEERREHAEEAVDASSPEGFPVVATRSKEFAIMVPPLGLK